MSASKTLSKFIKTDIIQDKRGVYVATSKQLKGLLAVSRDRQKLASELIPRSIADLYRACGVEVVVTPAEDGASDESWVATPVELARKMLEEIAAR